MFCVLMRSVFLGIVSKKDNKFQFFETGQAPRHRRNPVMRSLSSLHFFCSAEFCFMYSLPNVSIAANTGSNFLPISVSE